MMNWKNQSLFDWVISNPPFWANAVIRDMEQDYPHDSPPDESGVREFVYLTEFSNQDISPDAIIGQWNHYAGQTWLEAITDPQWRPGKIQDCLRQADSNPDYYFHDLSGIHLTSYDGRHWYSHNGGNHRIIIGKFMMAMADSLTGKRHLLPNVSVVRYHIDHECRDMYKRLSKLIEERGADIHLDVRSVPIDGLGKCSEVRVFVSDNRWGENLERFGWISSSEFMKFSDWVIGCDGVLSKWDKLKNSFGSGNHHKLFYPGMSGEFLSPPDVFHLLITRAFPSDTGLGNAFKLKLANQVHH